MNTFIGNTWKCASATTLLLATACSQVSFTPGAATNTQTSVGSACSGNIATTKKATKMLFILDMSGSNQAAPGCTLSPSCTDGNKQIRAGSVQTFFNDYGVKSNFGWSLETFQGTTASPLITNGPTPAFSGASAMQAGINNFLAMADVGETPYMAALTLAVQTIQMDPDLNASAKPQYVVVFMSDGQPTGADDTRDSILAEINAMTALAPGRVTFNTVYYGTSDTTASGLLQDMATSGAGHFLNTNTNPTGLDFKISDLIEVPCP